VIGCRGLLKIVPVIAVQDLPDLDLKADRLVVGRKERLILCIQPDTPDAFCDEDMVFRTGRKKCRVDSGDGFPQIPVFLVKKGIISGCKVLGSFQKMVQEPVGFNALGPVFPGPFFELLQGNRTDLDLEDNLPALMDGIHIRDPAPVR
jgi:hypothetical protein